VLDDIGEGGGGVRRWVEAGEGLRIGGENDDPVTDELDQPSGEAVSGCVLCEHHYPAFARGPRQK
jgi:hypothetical protein